MPTFEIEFRRVIIMKARVEALSAAEVRRRMLDVNDSYADDLRHDATDQADYYTISSIRPVARALRRP